MTSSAPPPGESPQQSTTVEQVHSRQPREEFRRARTRSQTVIFGSSILGLVVALLVGLLGVSGALPLPFGDDFSKKEVFAEPGDIPCPTPGARATSPDGVSVRVLNTTSTPGLAAGVATSLEELGYTIAGTDNSPQFHGLARIEAGPRGVDDAYALARFFPGEVRVVLTSTEDRTLTLLLGNAYEGLVPAEERTELLDRHGYLIPLQGCLPVAEPADGWALPQSEQSGQSGAQSDEDAGAAE